MQYIAIFIVICVGVSCCGGFKVFEVRRFHGISSRQTSQSIQSIVSRRKCNPIPVGMVAMNSFTRERNFSFLSVLNPIRDAVKPSVVFLTRGIKKVSKFFTHLVATLLLIISFSVVSPRHAYAARNFPTTITRTATATTKSRETTISKKGEKEKAKSSSKDTSSTSNKSPRSQANQKKDKQRKAAIEIELNDMESQEVTASQKRALLNKIGFACVGLTALYIIVTPSEKSKKVKPPSTPGGRKVDINFDSLLADEIPTIPTYSFSKKGESKGKKWEQEIKDTRRENNLRRKPQQDFFDVSEEDKEEDKEVSPDDVEAEEVEVAKAPAPAASTASVSKFGRARTPSSMRLDNADASQDLQATRSQLLQRAEALENSQEPPDDDEPLAPPFGIIMAAPDESKLPKPASPPPPPSDSSSGPKEKAKGLGGMLNRLFQKPGAGRPADLTQALSGERGLESEAFRRVTAGCLAALAGRNTLPELEDVAADMRALNSAQKVARVVEERDAWELSEQAAAEAFADVTNAVIVRMVDRAAATVTSDQSPEAEAATVAALDELTDLVAQAGALFQQSHPQAIRDIQPILYNGKTKRATLESLYLRYLKATMNMEQVLAAVIGTTPDPSAAAKEEGPDRTERLPKLQFLLGIKENKRSSLEQKLVKDMLMGGMGGAGGGGMGAMMDAFKGPGGLGGLGGLGGADAKQLEELMAGAGGMPNMEGMPDMKDMKPEEMERFFKDAMNMLKESLREGSISRQDVLEFEKVTNTEVNQMVKMLDAAKGRGLNADMVETIDLLRQLAQIKNK